MEIEVLAGRALAMCVHPYAAWRAHSSRARLFVVFAYFAAATRAAVARDRAFNSVCIHVRRGQMPPDSDPETLTRRDEMAAIFERRGREW